MKAIVTGGAGFIGSHLVDALLARGDEVAAIDDLSTGKEANVDEAIRRGASLHVEDIRDGAAIRRLLEAVRPDVVFHLAAQVDVRISLRDPAYDARTNVEGTVNLLESARLAGAQRFVFASTGGAIYGDTDVVPTPEEVRPAPMAAYGLSKLCAEEYLGLYDRLYGMSTLACRFGNVYGPRQDPHGEAGVIAIFSGRLREGRRPTVFGTGRQTRDYIYVADVVSGLLAAADSDHRGAVNLGTEEETTVLELVELMAGFEPDVDFTPELQDARLGELDRSCLAVGLARETLGWQAQTRIAEGLRLTYDATAA